eukprot:m51a1_g12141 hypothetical protein (139) ;mRNA; r:2273-2952
MEVLADVVVDYVAVQQPQVPRRQSMRKTSCTLSLCRDEWDHVCLRVASKTKKHVFRLDCPLRVFGDQAAQGRATVALELPGGSIVHVLIEGAEAPKLQALLGLLERLQQDPALLPEDLGIDQYATVGTSTGPSKGSRL